MLKNYCCSIGKSETFEILMKLLKEPQCFTTFISVSKLLLLINENIFTLMTLKYSNV